MYISWYHHYHHHHHHPFMTFISKKRVLNFAAGGTPQNKPKTFDRTTLAKQPVLSGSSSFQHLSTRSSSLWRRWEHPEPPKDWSVLLLTIFIKLLRGTFASSSGNLALLPLIPAEIKKETTEVSGWHLIASHVSTKVTHHYSRSLWTCQKKTQEHNLYSLE